MKAVTMSTTQSSLVTRVEFLEFHKEARYENNKFHEKSQQIIGEIKQMIATLLARKSYLNNNDQYIQQHTLSLHDALPILIIVVVR